MPTTSLDERLIEDALRDLIKATANCTKEDLKYLLSRQLLPPGVHEWLRLRLKERSK